VSEAEGFRSEINSDSSATIRLDPRVYSKEALLRACYWHSGTAYIQIPESPDPGIVVHITLKQQAPSLENPKPSSISRLVGEFCNSVLDFELRRQIEAETAPIRQLILAKAFSESGVLEDNPPGNIDDPVAAKSPGNFVRILNSSEPPTT
jgi:His-Xaa-Ser system protein HxsD